MPFRLQAGASRSILSVGAEGSDARRANEAEHESAHTKCVARHPAPLSFVASPLQSAACLMRQKMSANDA